jgi:hypothetical protein
MMMMMFPSRTTTNAAAACTLFGVLFAVILSVSVVPVVEGQGLGGDPMSLIPSDILEDIPEECRGNDDAEFDSSVICAISNLSKCFGIVSLIDEFSDIPNAENITDCIEINEPYCKFVDACSVCADEFESLVTCIVLKSDGISQNQTDFIDSCSLGCDGL